MICWTSEGITAREEVPNAAPCISTAGKASRKTRKTVRFIQPRSLGVYCSRCDFQQLGLDSSISPFQPASDAAFLLTSETKAGSSSDSRLISTLANAPVMAALARAAPTVRSDAILGLVMGFKDSMIAATCFDFSATPSGMLVAFLRAELMAPEPSLESLAALYAFTTSL